MIFDKIENGARYAGISPLLAKALEAVPQYANSPVGRYEIDGDLCYLVVQEYETKTPEDCLWETHHSYIDVHCPLSGEERVGYALDGAALEVVSPFDAERDAELLRGEGASLVCTQGAFVVFFPGQPHRPGMSAERRSSLRKIVLKIRYPL